MEGAVIHRCCDCKAVHRWEFDIVTPDPHSVTQFKPFILVRITRIDRRKK